MKRSILKPFTLFLIAIGFSLLSVYDTRAQGLKGLSQPDYIILYDLPDCISHEQEIPDQSESEVFDDSNPPTWIEALEAYLGDQVQEATYEVKVERVYDPESGLIIERIIDPLSKDSGLIMELVYDPETNEVQLTAVCDRGGGWSGSVHKKAMSHALTGTTLGVIAGSSAGLLGVAKGATLGFTAGFVAGIVDGLYDHWYDYHSGFGLEDRQPETGSQMLE